jgi:hypothetical protein
MGLEELMDHLYKQQRDKLLKEEVDELLKKDDKHAPNTTLTTSNQTMEQAPIFDKETTFTRDGK